VFSAEVFQFVHILKFAQIILGGLQAPGYGIQLGFEEFPDRSEFEAGILGILLLNGLGNGIYRGHCFTLIGGFEADIKDIGVTF
jgi:hypothetical protein